MISPLPLPLLVARVFTDNQNNATALDNLALLAAALDRWLNLHDRTPSLRPASITLACRQDGGVTPNHQSAK